MRKLLSRRTLTALLLAATVFSSTCMMECGYDNSAGTNYNENRNGNENGDSNGNGPY